MNEKWFGARITGAVAAAPSRRAIAARAEEDPRVERGDDAHGLVDPVGLARARALVEAVEVLHRARVLVDLLLHRREILGRLLLLLHENLTLAFPRPAAATLERAVPAVEQRRRARPRTCAARSARARAELARTWSSVSRSAPTPASSAAPSAVVSATSGTTTGTPSTSAWNCISQRLTVAPPSARSSASGSRAGALHRPHRVDGLVGHRLERRAREVRAAAAAREPDDRPARVGIPVRRAQPGERGHEVDAVVGVQRAASASVSAASAMIPSPSRSHCTAAPVTKIAASSA